MRESIGNRECRQSVAIPGNMGIHRQLGNVGNHRQLAITGIHNWQFPPVFRGFRGFFGIINYTEGREFKLAIPSSACGQIAEKYF